MSYQNTGATNWLGIDFADNSNAVATITTTANSTAASTYTVLGSGVFIVPEGPANGLGFYPNPPWPQEFKPEAEFKAEALLKEIIGEEKFNLVKDGKRIKIGDKYELNKFNCYKKLPDGTEKRFCIMPNESLPWADELINKILPLVCEPDFAESMANWKF